MNRLLVPLMCFVLIGCATTAAVPKLVLPEIDSSLLIPPPDLKTIQPDKVKDKKDGIDRN